ncbi:aminotransferase class I/II-fold pyridoxal phosphate-dependent enzyme [Candidatus Poribacteria bacterium]|nr:aminotransferase class I/II-fold pyridoxal phosphate-dependent enzyme [Candidatus Poribacteria bacterium]
MNIFSKRLNRLPPYMFGKLKQLTHERRQQGIDIIDLGMGNPNQRTPQPIIDKLTEAAQELRHHRYSASKGIYNLRREVSWHYERRFGVDIDPNEEAIAVIGTKEGLGHLALALIDEGDLAMVPNPTFPIHMYSVVLAGGSVVSIPLEEENDFVPSLEEITRDIWPRPKVLILSFPHNPTGAVVDLGFFEEVVGFAKHEDMIVIHDLAYADIVFDGYKAPSFLQAKGAKDVGVEFISLSKSYNMAGWRCGFAAGNRDIIEALARIKGYYDYGIFPPIQVAAIMALRTPIDEVMENTEVYWKRRDVLVDGLNRIGWKVAKPQASMFVWAPIPDQWKHLDSLEFSMKLLNEAEVCVSPGAGFGHNGEGYIRIALVENEDRIRQAVRQIRRALFS